MVTQWLKCFCSATLQMYATKIPMLSTTHAIFRGLQTELQEILANFPDSINTTIEQGILKAHHKLSIEITDGDDNT